MTQHDFTIADAPGLPVRLDLQGALQALAVCSSGDTPPTAPMPGMLWLNTSVPPDGVLLMRDLANASWLPVIPGLPAKASSAEVIAGTDDSKYVTPKKIADRDLVTPTTYRNRLLNPAMQISQENGDTAQIIVNTYPADMWMMSFVGGVHSAQRVASITPRKSPRRLRWTVVTPKASLAATDYIGFFHRIEGIRMADFGWGAAQPKQIIVRFGFRGPAGTYAVSIRNNLSSAWRSYIATITISAAQANTDTEQVIIIPGDAAGTWTTDETIGLTLTICMAAGTTYQTTTATAWMAGNFLVAPACSNGMAVAGVFEIFDLGLYLDPLALGVPPLWEMPDEASELLACQRYFCAGLFMEYHGAANSGASYIEVAFAPAPMRATPTFAGTNFAAPTNFPTTMVAPVVVGANFQEFRETRVASATGASFFGSNWSASARL